MKVFFTFLLLFFVVITNAQRAGTLDKSFGEGGFVAGSGIGVHYAIAQQHSGKLVTAGGYSDLQFNGYGNFARYLPDGTLDSSFGVNGFVLGSVSLYEMVLQTDDKMVIVGVAYDTINPQLHENCVARYLPDGRLDSSFGNNGITLIPQFPQDNYYKKIKLETDGSIIIGGEGFIGEFATIPSFTFLSRLSADGLFDFKFGKKGRVVNETATTGPEIGTQQDGKIILAGGNFHGRDYVLSRYNEDGTIDSSFGNNGTIVTSGKKGLLGNDYPESIVVQPDGKIVIGGKSAASDEFISNMATLRYNTNGTLDSSFGNGGKVFIAFAGNYASVSNILLQPDGKIVLSGGVSNYVEGALALCRLNTNGTLDSSFAVNGKQLTQYTGGDAGTDCAVLQKDGKILQGGEYYNDSTGYTASLLVRYNGGSKKQIIIANVEPWLQNHTITWNGLSEENIAYYAVEQSNTSIKGFTSIATVSGAGNLKEYSFTNSHLLTGTNYYRIKAVSVDGGVQYSDVVSADNAAALYSLYPNPARDYITVRGLATNTASHITIADGNGMIKRSGESKGGTEYRFAVADLYPGVYYINVTTGGKTEVVKWVKE